MCLAGWGLVGWWLCLLSCLLSVSFKGVKPTELLPRRAGEKQSCKEESAKALSLLREEGLFLSLSFFFAFEFSARNHALNRCTER